MTSVLSTDLPQSAPIRVERWPTEIPLLVLVVLAAAAMWLVLALTIFGLIYAFLIGLFLFLTHVVFIAYVRGSAVRLGPDQFPELHSRVEDLSARAGLQPTPEAYLLQAGGVLNAFATRFLRSEMIILFSDLLEACGDDDAARDMIVGHEIGHLRCGHLRWIWLLFPGFAVPFLGSAYSRAREYTCDRYGAALCGNPRGARLGLTILAAGGKLAPRVDVRAFVSQRERLNTGWMTLGTWLATHPPLSARIAALEPALATPFASPGLGPARALGLLVLGFLAPVVLMGFVFTFAVERMREVFAEAQHQLAAESAPPFVPPSDVGAATARAREDLEALSTFVAQLVEPPGSSLPADEDSLYKAWTQAHPDDDELLDPFDGRRYGYQRSSDGRACVLWSSGPDGRTDTPDDLEVRWPGNAP